MKLIIYFLKSIVESLIFKLIFNKYLRNILIKKN